MLKPQSSKLIVQSSKMIREIRSL